MFSFFWIIGLALIYVWSGAWVLHLAPDDWYKQWWAFPAFLTLVALFVLSIVAGLILEDWLKNHVANIRRGR